MSGPACRQYSLGPAVAATCTSAKTDLDRAGAEAQAAGTKRPPANEALPSRPCVSRSCPMVYWAAGPRHLWLCLSCGVTALPIKHRQSRVSGPRPEPAPDYPPHATIIRSFSIVPWGVWSEALYTPRACAYPITRSRFSEPPEPAVAVPVSEHALQQGHDRSLVLVPGRLRLVRCRGVVAFVPQSSRNVGLRYLGPRRHRAYADVPGFRRPWLSLLRVPCLGSLHYSSLEFHLP